MPTERKRTKLSEPYSRDTTPEAQRFLNQVVREMPQLKRSRRLFELAHFARELAITGHQSRDAKLTRREAELLVIKSMLGRPLYEKVYVESRA
jgi:hypothetical protein